MKSLTPRSREIPTKQRENPQIYYYKCFESTFTIWRLLSETKLQHSNICCWTSLNWKFSKFVSFSSNTIYSLANTFFFISSIRIRNFFLYIQCENQAIIATKLRNLSHTIRKQAFIITNVCAQSLEYDMSRRLSVGILQPLWYKLLLPLKVSYRRHKQNLHYLFPSARHAPLTFSVNINWSQIIYANTNKSKWQVLALFTQNTSRAICIHFTTSTNNGGS